MAYTLLSGSRTRILFNNGLPNDVGPRKMSLCAAFEYKSNGFGNAKGKSNVASLRHNPFFILCECLSVPQRRFYSPFTKEQGKESESFRLAEFSANACTRTNTECSDIRIRYSIPSRRLKFVGGWKSAWISIYASHCHLTRPCKMEWSLTYPNHVNHHQRSLWKNHSWHRRIWNLDRNIFGCLTSERLTRS